MVLVRHWQASSRALPFSCLLSTMLNLLRGGLTRHSASQRIATGHKDAQTLVDTQIRHRPSELVGAGIKHPYVPGKWADVPLKPVVAAIGGQQAAQFGQHKGSQALLHDLHCASDLLMC